MEYENMRFEMLRIVCLATLFAVFLPINGCNGAARNMPETTAAAVAKETPALESPKAQQSYALGIVLGNQFRDKSIDVDMDIYVRGLEDGLKGDESMMTEHEARTVINMLQKELKSKRNTPGVLDEIKISFKLDPRLTRAQYMGDRWVSPPTFTSTLQAGSELTVEARAQGIGADGAPIPITPEWIPADTGMVTVTPVSGEAVRIIVKRAGQTRLKVVSRDITKELFIKGLNRDGGMQVEISQ